MGDILGERDDAIPERPTRVSEPSRESQLPKRFYKEVKIEESQGLYSILLDGRPVKTPGKAVLGLSNQDIAQEMANEWAAQEERIDPMTMPITRLVNTAVDGVALDMQAVKEDLIRYAGTDMICYRADGPDELVALQRRYWDPLIDWAQTALNARFLLAEGVMHVEQPPETIAAFSTHVGMINEPVVLAACHVVTSLTGSATLAMALLKKQVDVDEAWVIAHVDEDWNSEQWGTDKEALERRALRLKDMRAACQIMMAMG